ncbi:MAG: FecR domain-containing protein [Rhizobium sp.]|nr:FecR domain-containing protein [Rhizobium sp.]
MPSVIEEKTTGFRHPDPVTDQALEWVLRLEAGEAERAAFDAWLAEGADRGEALARVRALYDCPALTVATAQAASARTRPGTVRSSVASASMLRRAAPLALAASIAAAVIVPLLGSDWLLRLQADHRTDAGEITTIDLPDGSRMQMNSQTAVMLDFENGRRAVRLLDGEAYFDVAHDVTRPFTVTGGFGTVRVTGTAFNVARGEDEDLVHLDSGRVMLVPDGTASEPVALTPGQTAAISSTTIALLPDGAAEYRLAWRDGWIELSAVPLRTALDEIGRHVDISVMTLPGPVLDTPVSSSFRIAEAGAAIDSVVTAAGATIERLPGGILFIH